MIQARLSKGPLEFITRTIVEGVRPRRVILFGSRARGDARLDSDIDIVVELDDVPQRASERRRDVQSLFDGRPWEIQITIRTPGEIDRRYNDPGYIDWDIAREGKFLYRDPALPPESWEGGAFHRVREEPSKPESFLVWIERAKDDRLAIKNHLASSDVPWGYVCFHAQQAAEKFLKALLVRKWKRPARTHKLQDLLAACRKAGYVLPQLDEACKELSKYAVDPRYPGLSPTEDEGRAAVAAMERIVAACEPLRSS